MSDRAMWRVITGQTKTRAFHVATNDETALSSIIRELKPGANLVTAEQAEEWARVLAHSSDSEYFGRARRQNARRLWDLFHDPYEVYPY